MPEPRTITVPLTPPQSVESTTAQVWDGSDPDAAAIVLAHGAGTDMTHRLMQRHAADLVGRGHAVALFNFAYTERGGRRPDPAPRLEQAWRDVIAALRPALGADRPLVIGGRSMGGRIASMVAVDAESLGVDGVACLAYPLHPPGKPEKLRVAHWPSLTRPILLLSGDRDSMAPLDSLRAQLEAAMPDGLATLHVVAGADHSYRVRKSDGRTEDEVCIEVADVISDWSQQLRTG
ncbi:alpha/beta family hydrolase [Euzebya pacifica]|uniref:alpha/beta family hydrolase n=1 Tax=Euzebya pacifica TaxID=1608957 RepID=UPI0030FBF820